MINERGEDNKAICQKSVYFVSNCTLPHNNQSTIQKHNIEYINSKVSLQLYIYHIRRHEKRLYVVNMSKPAMTVMSPIPTVVAA